MLKIMESRLKCLYHLTKRQRLLFLSENYSILKSSLTTPHLLNLFIDYAEKLLKKITTKDNIKDQVRRFIKHKLEDNDVLDVNLAAKKLNMSRHTLYRNLKKEGVSFQSLAEEVRQAKAKHYLQENNISISEVAYLLRFSELSAFSRAFKRWTGESPAQFRINTISK